MGGAWIKSCILGQSPQRRGFSTMWKGEEGGSGTTVQSSLVQLQCCQCSGVFWANVYGRSFGLLWVSLWITMDILWMYFLSSWHSCKNVPTSRCSFFLAGANFWAKHTKNYATMSILLIVLAFTTVLISLLSQHTVLQTP